MLTYSEITSVISDYDKQKGLIRTLIFDQADIAKLRQFAKDLKSELSSRDLFQVMEILFSASCQEGQASFAALLALKEKLMHPALYGAFEVMYKSGVFTQKIIDIYYRQRSVLGINLAEIITFLQNADLLTEENICKLLPYVYPHYQLMLYRLLQHDMLTQHNLDKLIDHFAFLKSSNSIFGHNEMLQEFNKVMCCVYPDDSQAVLNILYKNGFYPANIREMVAQTQKYGIAAVIFDAATHGMITSHDFVKDLVQADDPALLLKDLLAKKLDSVTAFSSIFD